MLPKQNDSLSSKFSELRSPKHQQYHKMFLGKTCLVAKSKVYMLMLLGFHRSPTPCLSNLLRALTQPNFTLKSAWASLLVLILYHIYYRTSSNRFRSLHPFCARASASKGPPKPGSISKEELRPTKAPLASSLFEKPSGLRNIEERRLRALLAAPERDPFIAVAQP